MPGKDGTGPMGGGSGSNQGRPFGSGGGGRMGGPASAGPDGYCVCPQCGARVKHQRGVPCNETKCPECNTMMARG